MRKKLEKWEDFKNALETDKFTAKSLFELFFDDEVVNFMVNMTNLYAWRDKRKNSFTTNANEMQFFIAKLLLTDYKQLPQRKCIEKTDPMY